MQIVETAVLSPRMVNETHFEFERDNPADAQFQHCFRTLNVAQSFVAGGSGYSAPGFSSSYDLENYYEIAELHNRHLGRAHHEIRRRLRNNTRQFHAAEL